MNFMQENRSDIYLHTFSIFRSSFLNNAKRTSFKYITLGRAEGTSIFLVGGGAKNDTRCFENRGFPSILLGL